MATKKAVWQGFVKSPETGKPVSGAEVRVFDADSGAAVTLYEDRDGTPLTGGWPAFSDSSGFVQFYVDPARIRIEAYDGGLAAQFDDVLVGLLDDGSVTRDKVSSDIVTQVANVTELRALTGLVDGQVVEMTTTGRAGLFRFNSSDLSAEVSADTQSGIYVAPDFDATGVSGAWVRRFGQQKEAAPIQLNAGWFGLETDGLSSQRVILDGIVSFCNYLGDANRANYDGITVTFPVGRFNIKSAATVALLASNVEFKMDKNSTFIMKDGPLTVVGSSEVFVENISTDKGHFITETSDTSFTDCAILKLVNCARIFIDRPQLYRMPHIVKGVASSGGAITTVYLRNIYGLGHPSFNWVDMDTTAASVGAGLYLQNVNGFPYAPPANPAIVPKAVTAATNANPVQVTVTGHGYTTGDRVQHGDVGGMTEINGVKYTITVVDADNYTLDGVDGSAFGTYTGGGKSAELHWSEAYGTGVVRINGKWDTAKIQGGVLQHWAWLWRLRSTGTISFVFSEDVTWDYGGEGHHEMEFAGGTISNVKVSGGWTFTMNGDFWKPILAGGGSIVNYSITNHDVGLLGGHFFDEALGRIIDINISDVRVRGIGRIVSGGAKLANFQSAQTIPTISKLVQHDPDTPYGAGASTYLLPDVGVALGAGVEYSVANCSMLCLTTNYSLSAPTSGGGVRMVRGNRVKDGSLPEYVTTASSTMPASEATTTNHSGLIQTVNLRGGTITNVSKNGVVIMSGSASYSFDVRPGENWSCAYSSAPVLVYSYRD